jgi:hypothetical protein
MLKNFGTRRLQLLDEQERQWTYKAVLRRLRINNVAVESSTCYIFWVCVCSLSCPACNVHTPYYHLWLVRLYNIFPCYKRYNLKEKVTDCEMSVLIFSSAFVINISHSEKNWARYYHKCTHVFMLCMRYSRCVAMKLELCQQVIDKYWQQISLNFVKWGPGCSVRTDGRADRHGRRW